MILPARIHHLLRCRSNEIVIQAPSRRFRQASLSVHCGSPQSKRSSPSAEAGRTEEFPNESLEFKAEDGLFPRRQPGNFPAVGVRKSLVQRFASAVGLESVLGDDAAAEATATLLEPAAAEEAEKAEYDPLRDGPLRYCGYANECGEAFAAWVPGWGVPLSYGVAIMYVLVDTFDKYSRAHKQARMELDSIELDPSVDGDRLVGLLAADNALDTVVWQMLASVIIPGYTIHTIVGFAHTVLVGLETTDQLQAAFVSAAPGMHTTAAAVALLFDKALPTMIGLAAIPFIVHPIDEGVHAVLNASMRPAMKKVLCGPGGGSKAGLAACATCAAQDPLSQRRDQA